MEQMTETKTVTVSPPIAGRPDPKPCPTLYGIRYQKWDYTYGGGEKRWEWKPCLHWTASADIKEVEKRARDLAQEGMADIRIITIPGD